LEVAIGSDTRLSEKSIDASANGGEEPPPLFEKSAERNAYSAKGTKTPPSQTSTTLTMATPVDTATSSCTKSPKEESQEEGAHNMNHDSIHSPPAHSETSFATPQSLNQSCESLTASESFQPFSTPIDPRSDTSLTCGSELSCISSAGISDDDGDDDSTHKSHQKNENLREHQQPALSDNGDLDLNVGMLSNSSSNKSRQTTMSSCASTSSDATLQELQLALIRRQLESSNEHNFFKITPPSSNSLVSGIQIKWDDLPANVCERWTGNWRLSMSEIDFSGESDLVVAEIEKTAKLQIYGKTGIIYKRLRQIFRSIHQFFVEMGKHIPVANFESASREGMQCEFMEKMTGKEMETDLVNILLGTMEPFMCVDLLKSQAIDIDHIWAKFSFLFVVMEYQEAMRAINNFSQLRLDHSKMNRNKGNQCICDAEQVREDGSLLHYKYVMPQSSYMIKNSDGYLVSRNIFISELSQKDKRDIIIDGAKKRLALHRANVEDADIPTLSSSSLIDILTEVAQGDLDPMIADDLLKGLSQMKNNLESRAHDSSSVSSNTTEAANTGTMSDKTMDSSCKSSSLQYDNEGSGNTPNSKNVGDDEPNNETQTLNAHEQMSYSVSNTGSNKRSYHPKSDNMDKLQAILVNEAVDLLDCPSSQIHKVRNLEAERMTSDPNDEHFRSQFIPGHQWDDTSDMADMIKNKYYRYGAPNCAKFWAEHLAKQYQWKNDREDNLIPCDEISRSNYIFIDNPAIYEVDKAQHAPNIHFTNLCKSACKVWLEIKGESMKFKDRMPLDTELMAGVQLRRLVSMICFYCEFHIEKENNDAFLGPFREENFQEVLFVKNALLVDITGDRQCRIAKHCEIQGAIVNVMSQKRRAAARAETKKNSAGKR